MQRDTIRDRLNYLHAVEGIPWRRIAELDEFKGIPPGTLCAFAKGYYEPKKNQEYRRRLGLPEIIKQAVARDEEGRFAKVSDR